MRATNSHYGNPKVWRHEIQIQQLEIRKNSEIQNPKYCFPAVPRCRWQMPSGACGVFPWLPNAPTDRPWLRASYFGFLSAFGIRHSDLRHRLFYRNPRFMTVARGATATKDSRETLKM